MNESEERAAYVEFIGKLLHKLSLSSLKVLMDVTLRLVDQ